ncbi:hypothetical protein V8C86DRAFT_2775895 [Haematococcus lacustris]
MAFLQQLAALYIKNCLVAWRNRRATLLRLLAPFFFLLLALLIDRALQADTSLSVFFKDVSNPAPEPIGPIPSCHEDVYIGSKDCMELAYSPDNAVAKMLIGNITSRNSVPITAKGFPTRNAVQAFLLDNPDYMIAAVHFMFDDPSAPNAQLQGFVIQTNTTIKSFKAKTQDLNMFVQLPLQSAVHREIARHQLAMTQSAAAQSASQSLSWSIAMKTFAHPTVSTFSVLGRVLGPFVFAACMFSFVTQIGAVVMEKEMGLKQAMRTMGMSDTAYWLSWGAWEITLAFITGHLIAIFGLILQFDLFLKNNYGLLFFLFFLFQLSMSSFGLFCATLVSKVQSAVYLGFLIFIIGWIMQVVVLFGLPYSPDYYLSNPLSVVLTVVFSAFPWDLLVKGFGDLGMATVTNNPGIRWNERASYCQDIPVVDDQTRWLASRNLNARETYTDFSCVMPLDQIYKVFIALWILYFVVAIYLDNVLKNQYGVRRPILYFLYPSYWFPTTAAPASALGHVLKEDAEGPNEIMAEADQDVLAEESRMRALLNHRTGSAGREGELAAAVDVRNAIEVFGLKKRYEGSHGCCGRSLLCCGLFDCCSCRIMDSFWPIKGSWFGIEQDQLFCLLGPNGAGKTTTINCLTGVLPPNFGEALIYGQSIRSTGGINKIRSLMGVCPQFDVLWPELTGREHLMLYGRIKGVNGWAAVKGEAQTLLDKVKLDYAADQRSGAYSGGMKRRLSVAIALLGDPKVVYLDEPTTGMDPISRRYVWDIIQEAKVGRAIVLTTHSMEEADILSDRIAIMALGRLRCIGSSIRLKQRFGSGYELAVSVAELAGQPSPPGVVEQRTAGVLAYFKQRLGLDPADLGRVYITFVVPRDQEAQLIPFLSQLEVDAPSLGITDTQLSLTSLEEVFLTIARQAALQAAQGGGGNFGAKKKDLHFCTTCMKVALLGLCLPLSIFAAPWWGRFIVGKEDTNSANTVTLPDGSTITVPPGQEYVESASGQAYKVVWGVDDTGNLTVQEARPVEQLPAAANGHPYTAPGVVGVLPGAASYPAVNGKARVPLPGNVQLEVGVNDAYVINPADSLTYFVEWGKDGAGRDAVLSCRPMAPGASAFQRSPTPPPPHPFGTMPVAQPVYYPPVPGYQGPSAGYTAHGPGPHGVAEAALPPLRSVPSAQM